MKKALSTAVAAWMLLSGCSDDSPDVAASTESLSADAELVGSDISTNGFVYRFAAWRENPSEDPLQFTDFVEVPEARIEEGALVIDARHGGGCRLHDYQVSWNGVFRESDPARVGIAVGHDANADTCRALLTTSLRLPLEPLRAAWKQAYQAEHGTLGIQIEGTPVHVVDTF